MFWNLFSSWSLWRIRAASICCSPLYVGENFSPISAGKSCIYKQICFLLLVFTITIIINLFLKQVVDPISANKLLQKCILAFMRKNFHKNLSISSWFFTRVKYFYVFYNSSRQNVKHKLWICILCNFLLSHPFNDTAYLIIDCPTQFVFCTIDNMMTPSWSFLTRLFVAYPAK